MKENAVKVYSYLFIEKLVNSLQSCYTSALVAWPVLRLYFCMQLAIIYYSLSYEKVLRLISRLLFECCSGTRSILLVLLAVFS